ncbi:MAG: response regulator, partial [Limisphaerales bacterium]
MNSADRIHVLLLEDTESDAFLIRASLGGDASDFEVSVVETLREARDALSNSQQFQIVVGDLNLPDSSSESTLEFLLKTSEQMPVIVLNSCDDPELADRCAARGAVCYSKQKLFDKAFAET